MNTITLLHNKIRMRFNKYTLLNIAFLLSALTVSKTLDAQITVTAGSTAAALASTLVGPGVTISSPVLTCNAQANGTFTVTPGTVIGTGTTVWGINTGVILSTGKATQAAGLETTNASTNLAAPGDPTLTTLAGATTYDACILEFDIIPTGDTIKFNYIFGSEEYNHSTCGPYNDAFAFFISGPGIAGSPNIALIPGTTIPVTVNTVNSGVPGAGYTTANCTAMGAGSPFTTLFNDNTGGNRFTMKGFTKVLTAVHDVIPCNTYHLKLTIADAGNAGYDSEVFIEQGSISSVTNVTTQTVCAGSTTTLTATPAGGTWTSSNTAIATIDPASGAATGIAAGTANMTYTTGAGCYKITALTVNPLPAITGITSACISSSITLTATPAGGTWVGGAPAIATITSGGQATGIALGIAPITYTAPTGCVITGTFTVYNLAPNYGPTTVCKGSTIALGNSTAGGTWSSSNTNIATVTAVTGIVTGDSAGTTTITYSMGGSCYSTTDVTVTARPAPPTTTSVHFCENANSTSLNASGINLLWYSTATGGTGTSISPVPPTTSTGATVWYVSQTIGGCESIRVPLTVTINPLPTFSITGTPSACLDDTLTFGVTGIVTPSLYAWTIPTGTTLLTGGTLNASTLAIKATNVTTQKLYLQVIDAATGCSGSDSVQITVNTPPVAVAYTPENACLGDTVSLALSGHSNDAYTYNWTVDHIPLNTQTVFSIVTHNSNSGGPYLISWNDTGAHVISVQAIPNNGGCPSKPVLDTVKVHSLPDANFTYRSFKNPPCLDDSLYFTARTYDYSNTYSWTPSHSFNDRTGPDLWAIMELHTTDVVLTVTNPFGCKASTDISITSDPCCRVDFPSAFTPNNDGKNDAFRPIFTSEGRTITGSNSDLSSYHRFHIFRIENRWGQTVFETTSNYPEWDGTFNGVAQDMGVYYYFISFDCDGGTIVQKGDVTLIR